MTARSAQITIIMPAYNVEQYVRRAIQSIQKQSFEDWELLVVDDGSRDRTGDIVDKMAARDIRISCFHTKNAGAPAARNLALDKANGRYVMFFDADDWAEKNMLQDMYNLAEKHQLDMVVAGFYIDTYYGSGSEYTTELKHGRDAIYTDAESFRKDAFALFDENQFYPPWNKLFLRSRIEELNIRFRDTFWDDFPFVLDNIRDIERVGVTSKAYYHFIRQRSESETARWRPDMYAKREEEHDWMLELYKHWGLSNDAASQEMIQRRYIERLIGCIENVCNPQNSASKKDKIAEINSMIQADRAQTALSIARPKSRMMKWMLGPIARKNACLAYKEGVFISFVKRHNTKLFAMLKARR